MKKCGDQKTAILPTKARAALSLLTALAAVSLPNNAFAQQTGEATVELQSVLTIVKNSDLSFGNFATGTNVSRFRMHAVTGNLIQLSGNAVSLGGPQTRASFTATGTPNTAASIARVQNSINIVRSGGTETMRVDNFWLGNSGGLRDQILDANGNATYYVGGRLRIGANQASGAYSGTFSITIEYQ